jgi:hypothetical protein
MAELIWDNNLVNLRDILADSYRTLNDSFHVVQQAGLNPAFIDMEGASIIRWHNILNYARQDQSSVDAIIDVALDLRGKDIVKDVTWERPVDTEQLEKIIGTQSTLLPISFLEMGLQRAKAIARIDLGARGKGSGFLIADDLLLTNHHVFENKDQARISKAQFNYQQTLDGLSATYDEYELDPEGVFETSLDDDWSVVKVKSKDGELAGKKWASLSVLEQDPKMNDFTIIIQHPSGGPKQIALYHNVIAYVDPAKRVVQYLTDTEPGSSGSPVFDTNWNLIALHHSGGWLREPGTESKQTFYRNEGIHVSTVIKGLQSKGVIYNSK